jgi:formylglycine-generating enzyme required for sulfatase activity
MLAPIGFWSYTRQDDEHADGSLNRLRRRLLSELQTRVGRRKVTIFQDTEAIPFGSDWQNQIDAWLGAASFFIPIITPSFLQSEGCCYEVTQFRQRAEARGWDAVIFPLYYAEADEFADLRRGDVHDPAVHDFIWRRQIFDFRDLRLRDPSAEDVRHRIAGLAQAIYQALLRDGNASTPGAAQRNASAQAATPLQNAGAVSIASPAAARPPPPAPLPGSIIRDGPGPEMVLIPAGSFVMGIPQEQTEREGLDAARNNDARPQHKVTIARPFYLGKYPITRGAFAAFAQATGFADQGWRNPGFAQTDEHPVVNVSHADAQAYATWLSRETGKDYRLPSEAEWEYAARAGTTTARFWDDGRAEACRYANVADETQRKADKDKPDSKRYFSCDDGFANTSPVGSFQPNDFGLYDMLGNVLEWTAGHWHENYDDAPDGGSAWTTPDSAGERVVRGGSWLNGPSSVRAGCRFRFDSGFRLDNVGFRLARTL